MQRIGMHTMIRGHEMIERGFDVFFDLGDQHAAHAVLVGRRRQHGPPDRLVVSHGDADGADDARPHGPDHGDPMATEVPALQLRASQRFVSAAARARVPIRLDRRAGSIRQPMSYYVRYFAETPVTLKALGAAIKSIEPQYKIDGGDLMMGDGCDCRDRRRQRR